MTDIASGADIIDRLNAERNARIADDTKMQCKICWYVYDPAEGCPENQTPPGTPFSAQSLYTPCIITLGPQVSIRSNSSGCRMPVTRPW